MTKAKKKYDMEGKQGRVTRSKRTESYEKNQNRLKEKLRRKVGGKVAMVIVKIGW
jgi:hypothetical protein